MKIIIAGAGSVGTYLAKMLYKAKKNIIVIDNDKTRLGYIDSHFDFLTVNGSATSMEVLNYADVKRADLFIAVTEIEEINITSAILAKKLGAKKTIARVANKEYFQLKNSQFFKELGIDELISPEILASKEISEILNQTGAAKSFDFANGKLSLFVIKLEKNAPIIGKTLEEVTSETKNFDYRAVAITRHNKTIIPYGDDVFQENDLFYVMCNEKGVPELMKYSGKQKFVVKNIMIMGGSRIGIKTAIRCQDKCSVKLIELEKEKSIAIADELEKTLVISGDGRDDDLLIEEGIEKMDAFIAVTGNSETNILSCWHAKKLGVRKTIAEVENMDYLDIAEKMDIDTIINKKLIAASHIYTHTLSAKVSSVQCLIETEAEILEFIVAPKARITRKKLKNTKLPTKCIIGGVIRGDSVFIAKGETKIEDGDRVVVFSLPEAIEKISKFFK